MGNGSILIISNSQEKANFINNKIKLLRGYDSVKIVSYIEAISVLNTSMPVLIIVYGEGNDALTIIKEIRAINFLDKVPILFTSDTFNEENLLTAFDYGIDDFFYLDNADSLILMRILLILQKAALYKQIDSDRELLINENIIDKQNDLYLKEKAPSVLKVFFTKSIEDNQKNTVFMYLRLMSVDGYRLDLGKLGGKIKKLIRNDDVISYGKSSGFYLMLYNAGKSGAEAVFTKILSVLSPKYEVYACAAEIKESFEEMEPVLYNTLKTQIENEVDFKYLSENDFKETSKDTEIKDENGKKFKDFKKEFLKSFEQIVAPVFYSTQTANSDKYKDSEIKYLINENESKFFIKDKNHTSELTITYPTYMNIIVDIKHYDSEGTPNVRRHTFDFDEFSADKLSELLEEMIKEFTGNSLINNLYNAETNDNDEL